MGRGLAEFGAGLGDVMDDIRRAIPQILLFALAWLTLEYVFVRTLAAVWVPLFAGGLLMWWFTTRRVHIDPHTFIAPYLLTVIAFIAHVYEEYTSFQSGQPHVMESASFTITFDLMLTFAASLAPIAWLLGAVMMLKRWSVGYFVGSTFLFGMMFIEPTHFLAPFLQTGTFHYVGGMWTALPLIALGWYTFFVIRREIKKATEPRGGA
jgi:hypothetical protein